MTDRSAPEPTFRHVDHEEGGAFYAEAGGERLGELVYARRAPRRIVIQHTEVSDALRGGGLGRRLVAAAVAWARESGTTVVPACPYARKVIQHDRAMQDVL